jgi:hypothetical protein
MVKQDGPAPEGSPRPGWNYDRLIIAVGLLLAAVLLLLSIRLPYWSIVLEAPQYPEGLKATAYVNRFAGDVTEIDELNHYIGMMKLGDAARLERSLAAPLMATMAGLALLSCFLRGWGARLLRLPLVLFPFGLAGDLTVWLWYAGHHLDPRAALSSSIKPFMPTVLGRGTIGQFHTIGGFEWGFWLALLAAMITLLTLLWPEGEERA